MFRAAFILLIGCAAFAAGNPAVGVEWRWKSLTLTVSPNVKALPYKEMIDYYVPGKSIIPGTHVVENCGQSKAADERIVGGHVAQAHAYPWQVALFIDFSWFCGGSIISQDWILTAAHCMDGRSRVEVVAGAHNLQKAELSQVTMVSTNFFTHEHWHPLTFQNDVALIRLPSSLPFTNAIQPVCLPNYSDPPVPVGTWVTLTGWGYTSDLVTRPADELHEVTRPIISNAVCAVHYGTVWVTDNIICIDASNGAGTCHGDSGGPMNVPSRRNGASSWVSRGIVSYGSTAGCESGHPDAFTRTSHFLNWIELKTGIHIGN